MSDDIKGLLDTTPNSAILNGAASMAANFVTACACFNIRKVARAVTNLYDSELQSTKLRATQATLLMALAVAEKATVSRLAAALGMDRTTLARDLKPLTEQGLVEITSGEDRRTRHVQLTEAGQGKLAEIIPLWQRAQAKLISDGIGDKRWSALYNELQELIRFAQP